MRIFVDYWKNILSNYINKRETNGDENGKEDRS